MHTLNHHEAAAAGPPDALDDEIQLLRKVVHRLAAALDPDPPAAGTPAVPPIASRPADKPRPTACPTPAARYPTRRGRRTAQRPGLTRRALALARCIDSLTRTVRAQAALRTPAADQLDQDLRAALDQVWGHLEACPDHFLRPHAPALPQWAEEPGFPGPHSDSVGTGAAGWDHPDPSSASEQGAGGEIL
jgi:hypothetical protein